MSSTTRALFLSALVACNALVGCTQPQGDDNVESSASAIVGGATTSAFPAVGALVQLGSPFCTGTLVTKRVVVTAAHCLDGVPAARMRFAIGPNAFRPEASVPVAQAVAHPEWNPRRIANDIGVVVLAADAPVAPIALSTTALDASWIGRELAFVGYGASNGFTGAGGGVKRGVVLPIAQIGATQFAYDGRTANTCFGDSGGPALALSEDKVPSLVGVTSFGDATCTQFGVDTRVDAFAPFLASFTQ